MSDTDLQLLTRYSRHHAEDAFAEIVRRHLNLVFSAALRQVRSPQLAEEVAQSVFIDLARQTNRLAPDTVVTAWLYQVTRRTAIDVVRRESRRQHREQVAVELSTVNAATTDDWPHVEPLLDEAMHALDDTDRTAVLLHYFESKSFLEVGHTIGASEDAARKRVSRAIEQLREFFAQHGVTVGAGALVVLISTNAIQAAPAGLAATISAAAALAGTTTLTTTATTATITKAVAMTALQKTLIATVVVASVGTGVYEAHRASTLRNQMQALQQQQSALTEQIQQLQRERDDAVKQPSVLPTNPMPQTHTSSASAPTGTKSPYEQLKEFFTAHNTLSREEIEPYLRQSRRSAESLLAAYRISHDPTYLREAATNFPNTPFVQLAVVADKAFPDDQRKWIDAFKASSPDNALAWYFSALDYFDSNQPELAIQELTQATRKKSFDTYAGQASQAVEEMCDSAGWPPLAAKAWAPISEPLTYLNPLRSLAKQMVQVQQQDFARGDVAPANSLASMGMALGNELRTGSPIEQLVGIAIEQKILAQLDPSTNYDFLGRPVSGVLAELDQQKQAIRAASETKDQILPTLNEAELTSYFERKKLYGEIGALQWLQSKHPQP